VKNVMGIFLLTFKEGEGSRGSKAVLSEPMEEEMDFEPVGRDLDG
jgi:hypothetical protein